MLEKAFYFGPLHNQGTDAVQRSREVEKERVTSVEEQFGGRGNGGSRIKEKRPRGCCAAYVRSAQYR